MQEKICFKIFIISERKKKCNVNKIHELFECVTISLLMFCLVRKNVQTFSIRTKTIEKIEFRMMKPFATNTNVAIFNFNMLNESSFEVLVIRCLRINNMVLETSVWVLRSQTKSHRMISKRCHWLIIWGSSEFLSLQHRHTNVIKLDFSTLYRNSMKNNCAFIAYLYLRYVEYLRMTNFVRLVNWRTNTFNHFHSSKLFWMLFLP